MTAEDIAKQKKEVLFSHQEALESRARLVQQAHEFGSQLSKVAALLTSVEENPDSPLNAESELLSLPVAQYALVDMQTLRALGNAIASARREVLETTEAKRLVGYCS